MKALYLNISGIPELPLPEVVGGTEPSRPGFPAWPGSPGMPRKYALLPKSDLSCHDALTIHAWRSRWPRLAGRAFVVGIAF